MRDRPGRGNLVRAVSCAGGGDAFDTVRGWKTGPENTSPFW